MLLLSSVSLAEMVPVTDPAERFELIRDIVEKTNQSNDAKGLYFTYAHEELQTRNPTETTKQHIDRTITVGDGQLFFPRSNDTFCVERGATIINGAEYYGKLNFFDGVDGVNINDSYDNSTSYSTQTVHATTGNMIRTLTLGAALLYIDYISGAFQDNEAIQTAFGTGDEGAGNFYVALQKTIWNLNSEFTGPNQKEAKYQWDAYQLSDTASFSFWDYLNTEHGGEFGLNDWTRDYDPVHDIIGDYAVLALNTYDPNNADGVTNKGANRQDILVAVQLVKQMDTPTPEPATLAILGLGIVGAGITQYRRRKV